MFSESSNSLYENPLPIYRSACFVVNSAGRLAKLIIDFPVFAKDTRRLTANVSSVAVVGAHMSERPPTTAFKLVGAADSRTHHATGCPATGYYSLP
jgi:hypothetical protein